MHYSEDSSAKKLLVIAIWILDTIHASFMCHVLYHYLIINYGVPTSLGYTVWFVSHPVSNMYPALEMWQDIISVHDMCSSVVLTWVRAFSDRDGLMLIKKQQRLVDMETSELQRNRFYSVTPAVAITALAEVLITVSLCVLLYDSGSGFASSGTKRLLNTLIVYAVNRCLLNLLVTIAELVEARKTYYNMPMSLSHILQAIELQNAWSTGLSLIIGSSSLNCRKRLRRQDSTNKSLADERISAIHFANPPRLSRDGARSKDEIRRIDVHEFLIIDIGADASLDKATTLQRDETGTGARDKSIPRMSKERFEAMHQVAISTFRTTLHRGKAMGVPRMQFIPDTSRSSRITREHRDIDKDLRDQFACFLECQIKDERSFAWLRRRN
ncbi:hypothetical protein EV401DRAFT_1895479 [Pisolithus croceorrhizus]|nr:hypothetical protein EV401DRAFT_1895479 [Pisolithus croceorrhizus]